MKAESHRLPARCVLNYLNERDTWQPHTPADFPQTFPPHPSAPHTAQNE